MTLAELKFHSKKGTITDDAFKKMIEDGKFSREELISEGVLTKDDVRRIFKVSRTQHLENMSANKYSIDEIRELVQTGDLRKEDLVQFLKKKIRAGEYTHVPDQIKDFINRGELDPNNLIAEGVVSQSEMDDIYDRPLPMINVGFESWDQIPALSPGRVDVFVLGVPGSGKSVFMAGLLYYARNNGWLQQEMNNISGVEYVYALTDAVENGILPPATPVENMQYMACDFKNRNNEWNPLTFIEMSGEIFRKCFGKPKDQIPAKFLDYLEHENSKLIIMAIDYQADNSTYSTSQIAQASYFEFVLSMLESMGTISNTRAIAILITKWDLSPDQSDEAANAFLNKRYRNLMAACENLEEKYRSSGLIFEVFKYSLGQFKRRNSYSYNPFYSESIYNWICSFMPVKKEPKSGKGLSWKNIFGKK